ncbi:hypothetical protein [Archangium sp.]|uniref:hypothetical protein n=1 Tax=Archangium sp. TaxID=1872627 RepID=UPI002D69238F|nr:hypothetical protein [Archangium sp.]HYO55622.1 hypothetical protein [Archangium sp.]
MAPGTFSSAMTNERHIFCELAISPTEAGAFEHTVSSRELAQAGTANQSVRQRKRFLIRRRESGYFEPERGVKGRDA